MSKLQSPRGTHDLVGTDFQKHDYIIEKAKSACAAYGFNGVDTPIFEFTQVFSRTLGDASDIVNKEMYTFEDRGGEKLTLRPEGTAGIARAVVSNGLTRQYPLKFYYHGPMFRYERPQKGRQRQFNQFGAEFIGVDHPQSDIEIIALAHSFLKSLGLSNLVLHINSIGDKESRDNYRSKLVEYFSSHKDKLSEDSLKRLEQNPLRILDSKDEGDQALIPGAPKLSESLNEESAQRFKTIIDGVSDLGIEYKLDESLVRGLDYYSHCVFEFTSGDLGAQNTVLAGGRYNELIKMMGGPDTACVGWACGIERLALLLNELPESARPIYVVPMGQAGEKLANKVLHELRNAGIYCETTYSGNMGKRLKKANNANASHAIIIGDSEIENNKLVVKDFDKGEQSEVEPKDLLNFFSSN